MINIFFLCECNMQQYHDLLDDILTNGHAKGDRTGSGTLSVFSRQMRFNLADGFPLVTSREINLGPFKRELLWFISGSTNINDLDAKIWNEWATESGDVGPIYGKQWTNWDNVSLSRCRELVMALKGADPQAQTALIKQLQDELAQPGINQLDDVIDTLKRDPDSRRMVISAWNPTYVPISEENILLYQPEKLLDSGVPLTHNERLLWARRNGLMVTREKDLDTRGVPNTRATLQHSPQENVEKGRASLPACHTMFQFYTTTIPMSERLEGVKARGFTIEDIDVLSEDTIIDILDNVFREPARRLHCKFFCRSQDVVRGTPANLALYAMLTHMIAQITTMKVGDLIWDGGDCHIYQQDVNAVKELLQREPGPMPTLKLNERITSLYNFKDEDIWLEDHQPQPKIKLGNIAV